MNTPSYVALSAQSALQRKMDVLANNIANASTPAYKQERMVFFEYLARRPQGAGGVSMVQDIGTVRDTRQGPLTRTTNPLDFALQGDGYFVVDTPGGPRETRNGRFQLNAQGQLVTAQGYTVHGSGGQPIVLPNDATDITITADGTITSSAGEAGKLEVVRFDNEKDLKPEADGFYVTEANPQPIETPTVLQGMVEESNVQPVLEVTRLMEVARRFANAQQMIEGEHDRLKNAIDKLSRVA